LIEGKITFGKTTWRRRSLQNGMRTKRKEKRGEELKKSARDPGFLMRRKCAQRGQKRVGKGGGTGPLEHQENHLRRLGEGRNMR